QHAAGEPHREELLVQDAARVHQLLIEVGVCADGDHRLQVWRLKARHRVLVDRVIGHAPESDTSIGPGLLTRPFDRVVEGLRLVNAPDSESARAPARAGPVDADESVTTRNPGDSVEALVVLVLVSVRVAQEVTLLHLLVVLGVLLGAPGMVYEGPPVNAAVHDHR